MIKYFTLCTFVCNGWTLRCRMIFIITTSFYKTVPFDLELTILFLSGVLTSCRFLEILRIFHYLIVFILSSLLCDHLVAFSCSPIEKFTGSERHLSSIKGPDRLRMKHIFTTNESNANHLKSIFNKIILSFRACLSSSSEKRNKTVQIRAVHKTL